jgi:hypothetical protein
MFDSKLGARGVRGMRVARPTIRSVCVVALSLAAGCGAFASTASAAPFTGLQRVEAASDWTSDDKSVEVACPAGKQLLSAAGEISGGFGEVLADDMTPVSNLNKAVFRGVEDSAYAPTWSVKVYGICSNPVPGLVRVRDASSLSSSNLQQDAFAWCAPGKFLVGANASITGADGESLMSEIEPQGALGAHVMGREEDAFDPIWWVTAVASCAPSVFPIPVVATGDLTFGPSDSVTVTCPAGTKVTSASGAIYDTSSFEAHGHVSLDDIRPSEDLQSVTVTAFETDEEQPNPHTGDWQVRAWAVCHAGTL